MPLPPHPRSTRRLAPVLAPLGAVLGFALLPAFAHDGDPAQPDSTKLAPTAIERQEARLLAMRLPKKHYLGLPIDDEMSEQVLDRYLDFLDPSRAYLRASDVADFEQYRDSLDDAFEDGQIDPAFTIFDRFQELRLARLQEMADTVTERVPKLDLDDQERLKIDREDVPWAKDQAELDELWRKRLESETLDLVLKGKTREEAATTLKKRYENLLNQVRQSRARDVFQMFMNALAMTYDPHTQYLAARSSEDFDVTMSLSLEGIGALLTTDGEYTRVDRLVHAGPAEKAGELKAGDRIVAVAQGSDGEFVDVVGWRVDEIVDLIRGPRGTLVKLQVLSADAPEGAPPHTVEITRDQVKLEEQAAQKDIVEVPDGDRTLRLGVIELPAFYMDFEAYGKGDPNYKSSTRDVEKLLNELKDENVDGVVLDLRENGGGSLIEAHELSGLFLGKRPIVQVRNPDGSVEVLSAEHDAVYTGPLVVLVDRLSASASEIFAAAIQDYGRGLVVGEPTFGKGTVQSVVPVGTGRLLVTVAKFYRVNGASTQHAGVTPDILFPQAHDPKEVGESALPHALLADHIDPLQVKRSDVVQGFLADLRAEHEARVAKDPDFQRLEKQLALVQETRSDDTISLQEETRRKELDDFQAKRDAIDAAWRKAKGLPPEEKKAEGGDETADASPDAPSDPVQDLADDGTADPTDSGEKPVDAERQEGLRILADLIHDETPKLVRTQTAPTEH